MAAAGCFFLLLLAREDGLEGVSGLGDIGEIHLGLKALGSARRCGAAARASKMGADLIRFVIFNGAGVSHLGLTQVQLRQQVENLPALYL